ncbi:MAG: tetratricopeptide repeat protein [Mariniblastus sp.]|nr:tetratricopeptide repeat protein [Mariniblastus sp.]
MKLNTTTTFLSMILAGCWISSNERATAQVLSPVESAGEVSVKDQIAAVYALTQSAKKATEYSEIDRQCQSILQLDLADKEREYVNSLASWALCRRGFSRFDLADAFLAAGNREQSQIVLAQAKTDFDQSTARDASRWRAYLGRGMVMVRDGNLEKAREDFEHVTQQQPDHLAGWFNLAEVQSAMSDYPSAIECYSKVIAADPADAQAYTGRGHCQFASEDYQAALTDYRLARQLAPLNQVAKYNCGEAEQKLGNWQAAYDCYLQATKVDPLPAAYRQAAGLLASCPDPEFTRPAEGLELIEKAIAMEGETVENLTTLAQVQEANGDSDLAATTRQKIAKRQAEAEPGPTRVAEEIRNEIK